MSTDDPALRKLTIKQQKFAEAYVETDGNGTESARRAGYKGNDAVLAQVAFDNVRKPNISKYIDGYRASLRQTSLMTAQDLAAFYVSLIQDPKVMNKDRLRAAAQLSRQMGYDQAKKHEVNINTEVKDVLKDFMGLGLIRHEP